MLALLFNFYSSLFYWPRDAIVDSIAISLQDERKQDDVNWVRIYVAP